MDGRHKSRFLNCFGTCCEVFGKVPTKIFIQAYFKALSAFTINQVEGAISQAIVSLKFFPRPVELIEIINGGAGDIESRAVIEATKVLEAVKNIGGYKSVTFDDPITNAVIRYGFNNWTMLCDESNVNDNKWFILNFQRIYVAYAKQGIKYTGRLVGITESKNFELGHDDQIPESILIGSGPDQKLLKNSRLPALEHSKDQEVET